MEPVFLVLLGKAHAGNITTGYKEREKGDRGSDRVRVGLLR